MSYYLTVKKEVKVKVPVGACRFIASVGYSQEEKEARAFIQGVREEFPDATHNAFAYKVGMGDSVITRTSDAHEPAGTAGPPLLSAIERAGLTNVVIVGTRYFGGVKLGIGGLIRAYRYCGEAGLKEAGTIKKRFYKKYEITFDYDNIGQIMNEIPGCLGEVQNVDYSSRVKILFLLPPENLEDFKRKFKDITRGKGSLME